MNSNTRSKKNLPEFVRLLILAFVLVIISLVSVSVFGRKCELDFPLSSPDNASFSYDESIVECIGQHTEGNVLTLEFRSVAKGFTYVEVDEPADNSASIRMLYVHNGGVITVDRFIGKSRGDMLFSASLIILLTVILLALWRKYRENTRVTLCRYSNAWLLGVIVFIGFTILFQLLELLFRTLGGDNPSVLDLLSYTLNLPKQFSWLLFPVAIIISLTISISNLILMKREGICLTNMLGFFLGIVLCAGTISMDIVYPLLESMGADVHRYSSLSVIIGSCIEDIIAITMSYLECVLLGASLSAVRAARHIPAFNKDFILILGCQITEDGGLTKLLQSRTDRAVEFARLQKEKTGKDISFVPSGGKGDDEVIAEAEAIRDYLVSIGIPEERIIVENKSVNTEQNIRFSEALIRERCSSPETAFSTTNYHVFRAGCIADELGIRIEGIGARTKPYFWINAFIREFIAALHYEKRSHIKTFIFILCCALPVEILIYISNLI